METVFYVLLSVCLSLMITTTAGVIMMQRIAHRERMELLKMIKAQSLSEYTAMDQPKPVKENNNFIRQAMKEAYNRGEDE